MEDALWSLHVDTMQRYVAATYGWVESVQVEMFRGQWSRSQAQRVLLDAGTIVAAWLVELRVDEVFLAFVEVASTHPRRGLGTAIVHRALKLASEARLPTTLTVMKANPDARRLYACLGFTAVSETPTHDFMVRSVEEP